MERGPQKILLKPFVAPQARGEKELGGVKVWKRLARMDSKLVVSGNELDSEQKKTNGGRGSVFGWWLWERAAGDCDDATVRERKEMT
ncbi:hypothetical protein NL676_018440 [Syzygium grande]|nr:hypothetical protein NL676_018440 [Syzygium grande]